MDGATLSCPHRPWRGDGKPCSQGSWVQNGPSRGQPRAWCQRAKRGWSCVTTTAYDGLEAEPMVVETAGRARAEGKARRASSQWTRRPSVLAASGGVPLAHRHAGLLARAACERLPTRCVGSCVPTKAAPRPGAQRSGDPEGTRSVGAWPGLARGPSRRDRHTGSGRCGWAAGSGRAWHGGLHAVVHQRAIAGRPARRAAPLRRRGPPASPGAPGGLSHTAAAAPSRLREA